MISFVDRLKSNQPFATVLSGAALVLVGCGGGGGTPSETAPSTVLAAHPTSDTTPSAPVPAATDGSVGGTQAESTGLRTAVYIDANAGNDAGLGTQATPWRTLAKLTKSVVPAGATIYLRCGSVWRESLALGSWQISDGTTLTSYGDNCSTQRPRITGADNFSGAWTKSGNVWSRAVPTSTPKITRLFIGGAPMRTAQWPNYAGPGREYALTSTGSTTSATMLTAGAADLPALIGRDIVGATLQVRTEAWIIESREVASFNATSGQMGLNSATTYAVRGGVGYVLQDKQWMLDAPGEFFHDTVAGRLYVYPSAAAEQANLNSATVEGSVRDTALRIDGRAGITISGLLLNMARREGLVLQESPAAVVDNIQAYGNGHSGLRVTLAGALSGSTRSATVKNSSFNDNLVYGIDGSGAPRVSVMWNSITETGTLASAGHAAAGIYGGDGAIVDGNTVSRAGYVGIRFSGTDNTQVTGNRVSNYCLRLSDCAAIYAYNGPKNLRRTSNQVSLVQNNIVLGATANLDGANGGGRTIAAGIYLDDFSIGVTVRGNIVHGATHGIYVHNGSQHVVENNRVWMTTSAALYANLDQTDADYMTNNVFRNNQLLPWAEASGSFPNAPKLTSSHAIWFYTVQPDLGTISSGSNLFSGNQFVQVYGQTLPAVSVVAGGVQTALTVRGWQNLNPGEGGVSVPSSYQLYRPTLGPELLPTGGFDGGLLSWSYWFQFAGGSVATTSAVNGCVGLCALFGSTSASDVLSSPDTLLTAGALHLVSFTATPTRAATLGTPLVARAVSPWDAVISSEGMQSITPLNASAYEVISYEGIFRPTISTAIRTSLKVATPGVPVAFDSVSVRAITGYTTGPVGNWAVPVQAPAAADLQVDCSTLGWEAGCTAVDVDGKPVVLPMLLARGTIKLLLRQDSAWRR